MLHCRRRAPGFVHGDLKPSNLLIDVGAGFRLKLTDFGIATSLELGEPECIRDLGTPFYRAPEGWDGRGKSAESDIYALGLILSEMFTGSHPFDGLTSVEEIKVRQAQGIKLPLFAVSGAETLPALIGRCLATSPSDRPTLEEIAGALDVAADDETPTAEREQRLALDWNNKGTALTALGKHRDAIASYVKALSLHGENRAAWANLALSFSKIGSLQDAEKAYKKCLSFPDAPASVHANYAAHLIRYCELDPQVAFQLALQHCDKAIRSDPNCADAWCNKAAALNSLGRYQDAAEAAQAARRLSPAKPYALVELAFAHWKLGKWRSARKFVEKALTADPNFGPAKDLKKMLRNRR
jgi:serine/threonine protein kinase